MKKILNLLSTKTRITTENPAAKKTNAWMDEKLQNEIKTDEEAVIDGVENANDDGNFNASSNNPLPSGSGGVWYLLPPPSSQRRAFQIAYILCRILMYIGLFILICGATAIVIGYAWPSIHSTILRMRGETVENSLDVSLMRISIDQDEEGNFYIPPEKIAKLLCDSMHSWKVLGFCGFALGASVMALSLIITSSTYLSAVGTRLASAVFAASNEENSPTNAPPVRVHPGGSMISSLTKFYIVPAKRAPANRISPTSGPVPVVEEIMKVQTTGLKKSPITPTADQMLCDETKTNEKQSLISP